MSKEGTPQNNAVMKATVEDVHKSLKSISGELDLALGEVSKLKAVLTELEEAQRSAAATKAVFEAAEKHRDFVVLDLEDSREGSVWFNLNVPAFHKGLPPSAHGIAFRHRGWDVDVIVEVSTIGKSRRFDFDVQMRGPGGEQFNQALLWCNENTETGMRHAPATYHFASLRALKEDSVDFGASKTIPYRGAPTQLVMGFLLF